MTAPCCEFCGTALAVRPCRRDSARFCSRSCKAKAHTAAINPNWRGGKTAHALYGVYNEMVARCTRPSHPRFADYGARGISVCDRWVADFWNFVADMGERPEGKSAAGRSLWTLDRVNNDGNYEPGNCRWATNYQQNHNRRTSKTAS